MAPSWWRPLTILVLGCACLSATCRRPVGFRISGAVDPGVRFSVFDPKDHATITIEEFVVSEVTGTTEMRLGGTADEHVINVPTTRNVWRLVGRATLPEIVYGKAPNGLDVIEGPLPLIAGRTYGVVVFGKVGVLWKRAAKGGCRFSLTEEGSVETPPGC
jgi:hypothetical protein